jgi:hypothetical protein
MIEPKIIDVHRKMSAETKNFNKNLNFQLELQIAA